MKMRKILLGLIATLPFATTSCSNSYTYEQVRDWVSNHYTEESENPKAAIATFSWDYHGTTGEEAFNLLKDIFNKTLPKMIPEFKDVVYWPGENQPIGKRIIVYHTLWIPPLSDANFEELYPNGEELSYKINGKELSVTDSTQKVADFSTSIIHVHNQYGLYRGIGVKVARGFINKDNIVKFKAIIELMYEDN